MPIDQSELRRAAARQSVIANHANRRGFLCHSHKDRDLALGLQQKLSESGLLLYIDWQDHEMPPSPNRATAERIQLAIKNADIFIFLATHNSMTSRWCPWEIGFADGAKRQHQIGIVPTRDDAGRFHGNEYLQLYRRIDTSVVAGVLWWFSPASTTPYAMQSF